MAVKVGQPPTIDGITGDPAWQKAAPVVVHDKIAGIDILLKAVYNDEKIFFLAQFPDPDESRQHKLIKLSTAKIRKSKTINTNDGQSMYLLRLGDSGASAYNASVPVDYVGDKKQQYTQRQPTGSRADVRAKGHWEDKRWSVEFSRNLMTGHSDDVQFAPSRRYFFGVSRYEIAGRKPNPRQSQPLCGAGDVYEKLNLTLVP